MTKGSHFDPFLCITTTINVFYFHSMQTFKHFEINASHMLFPVGLKLGPWGGGEGW